MPIFRGINQIKKIFRGNHNIGKVYIGLTQVFSSGAAKPSITFIGVTETTMTFTVTNNDSNSAAVYYELDNINPNTTFVNLAGGATSSNITITGLNPGQIYLIYARSLINGQFTEPVLEGNNFAAPSGTSWFTSFYGQKHITKPNDENSVFFSTIFNSRNAIGGQAGIGGYAVSKHPHHYSVWFGKYRYGGLRAFPLPSTAKGNASYIATRVPQLTYGGVWYDFPNRIFYVLQTGTNVGNALVAYNNTITFNSFTNYWNYEWTLNSSATGSFSSNNNTSWSNIWVTSNKVISGKTAGGFTVWDKPLTNQTEYTSPGRWDAIWVDNTHIYKVGPGASSGNGRRLPRYNLSNFALQSEYTTSGAYLPGTPHVIYGDDNFIYVAGGSGTSENRFQISSSGSSYIRKIQKSNRALVASFNTVTGRKITGMWCDNNFIYTLEVNRQSGIRADDWIVKYNKSDLTVAAEKVHTPRFDWPDHKLGIYLTGSGNTLYYDAFFANEMSQFTYGAPTRTMAHTSTSLAGGSIWYNIPQTFAYYWNDGQPQYTTTSHINNYSEWAFLGMHVDPNQPSSR